MKISELPKDLRKLALEYQKNETNPNYSKHSDDLLNAFNWENTKQTYEFWQELQEKPSIPTEDLKLNNLTVFRKDKYNEFKINIHMGNYTEFNIEEAQLLIEFLQAQI